MRLLDELRLFRRARKFRQLGWLDLLRHVCDLGILDQANTIEGLRLAVEREMWRRGLVSREVLRN